MARRTQHSGWRWNVDLDMFGLDKSCSKQQGNGWTNKSIDGMPRRLGQANLCYDNNDKFHIKCVVRHNFHEWQYSNKVPNKISRLSPTNTFQPHNRKPQSTNREDRACYYHSQRSGQPPCACSRPQSHRACHDSIAFHLFYFRCLLRLSFRLNYFYFCTLLVHRLSYKDCSYFVVHTAFLPEPRAARTI